VLMSVSEIADLTGLSKVSIYNKLKLKEIEPFIVKNKGITYVCDEGVALIKEGLNLKEEGLNSLNESFKEEESEVALDIENTQFNSFKEEFKDLNKDYINSLKLEIQNLKDQLEKKDSQIEELINLNKNNQILLKQQQDKEINQKLLEDHFQEVDEKLMDLRERMDEKKKSKKKFGFFSK
jgi:uncharacterized membrane protein